MSVPVKWVPVRAAVTSSTKQAALWTAAGIVAIVGPVIVVFASARQEPEVRPWFWGAWLVMLVALVAASAWYGFALSRVRDARLSIDTKQLSLGAPLRVRFEQRARRPLQIGGMTVDLVCTSTRYVDEFMHGKRRRQRVVSEAHRQRVAALPAKSVRAGELLATEQIVVVPPDAPPTDEHTNPKFTWALVVHTAIDGSPDYHASFPVRVVKAISAPTQP